MENCLITKLKGTVNNDALSILGKGKIHVLAESEASILFSIFDTVTLKTLDGSAKLYNDAAPTPVNTLTIDVLTASNYPIHFGAGDYYVTIDSVYNVKELQLVTAGTKIVAREYAANESFGVNITSDCSADAVDFNGYDFKNLKSININNANVVFDVSNLKKSNIVDYVNLIGRNIGGDITGAFTGRAVTGELNKVVIQNTNVYGSIDSLADGVFVGLAINNIDSGKMNDITGNLALMPASCKTVSFIGNNANFTWVGTRTGYAISISGNNDISIPNLGEYVDAMLINQAACDLTAPLSQWDKYIMVNGTHDPENTDAVNAIATIKAAGWSVYINGTEM